MNVRDDQHLKVHFADCGEVQWLLVESMTLSWIFNTIVTTSRGISEADKDTGDRPKPPATAREGYGGRWRADSRRMQAYNEEEDKPVVNAPKGRSRRILSSFRKKMEAK